MHPQGLHVLDECTYMPSRFSSTQNEGKKKGSGKVNYQRVVSYQNLPDGVPIDEAKDQEQGKYRPLSHPGMVFH